MSTTTDTPISPELLKQQLIWRYATKKFDASKKIPHEIWEALEHSLVTAPSSFGLQPWHFVVVSDLSIRKTLQEASWNQPQVVEASHLVVLAARTDVTATEVNDFLSLTSQTRGTDLAALEPYRNLIMQFLAGLQAQSATAEWTSRQTYIALGMLLCSAAFLGIDSCPLEGIDSTRYDEVLGLSARGFSTKVACALGYRASDDKMAALKKVRFDKERVISHL